MSLYSDRVKITVNFNGSLGFRCSLLAEGERLPLPHRERPSREFSMETAFWIIRRAKPTIGLVCLLPSFCSPNHPRWRPERSKERTRGVSAQKNRRNAQKLHNN